MKNTGSKLLRCGINDSLICVYHIWSLCIVYIYISWFKIRLIVSTHHDLPFRSFHSTFWEASNLCRSCLDKTQTEELLSIKDPYLDANIWYSDHQWILTEIWLNHVKIKNTLSEWSLPWKGVGNCRFSWNIFSSQTWKRVNISGCRCWPSGCLDRETSGKKINLNFGISWALVTVNFGAGSWHQGHGDCLPQLQERATHTNHYIVTLEDLHHLQPRKNRKSNIGPNDWNWRAMMSLFQVLAEWRTCTSKYSYHQNHPTNIGQNSLKTNHVSFMIQYYAVASSHCKTTHPFNFKTCPLGLFVPPVQLQVFQGPSGFLHILRKWVVGCVAVILLRWASFMSFLSFSNRDHGMILRLKADILIFALYHPKNPHIMNAYALKCSEWMTGQLGASIEPASFSSEPFSQLYFGTGSRVSAGFGDVLMSRSKINKSSVSEPNIVLDLNWDTSSSTVLMYDASIIVLRSASLSKKKHCPMVWSWNVSTYFNILKSDCLPLSSKNAKACSLACSKWSRTSMNVCTSTSQPTITNVSVAIAVGTITSIINFKRMEII